ncbi:MAG: AI-2E family transporter [Acidobacteriales bacterium]|jgi:predicted PurR-regulated permease PerM|nr:MAG: AI-2E family transporter [Terriglobales bacterium]
MRASFRLFTKENLFAAAFIVILVTLLWLVFSVLEPFWMDFMWALIFALTLYPVFTRLKNLLRGRGGIAALVLTILVLISLVLPGSFILMNLGQEAKDAYRALSKISFSEKGLLLAQKIRNSGLQPYLERWGIQPEQTEALLWNGISSGLKDVPKIIGERVSAIFKNLAIFVIHLLFVMVALFFFLRDGSRYAHFIVGLLPLERPYQERAVSAFSNTVTAVVRSMFVTAFVQGILAGAGFAVAGLPVPILLGLLTAINSFIPFLGATSVWLPASIWLIIQEEFLKGIGLGLYGFLVISMVDNFIKPLIIGESTKIPVFILFFTILGGLQVYGVLGIFLGPIIIALGMAFLTIYREIYLSAPPPKTENDLPPAESLTAGP